MNEWTEITILGQKSWIWQGYKIVEYTYFNMHPVAPYYRPYYITGNNVNWGDNVPPVSHKPDTTLEQAKQKCYEYEKRNPTTEHQRRVAAEVIIREQVK